MKKLIAHVGLLLFMILLIIVNTINTNITGLITGTIAATCWFVLVIQDIIDLKVK